MLSGTWEALLRICSPEHVDRYDFPHLQICLLSTSQALTCALCVCVCVCARACVWCGFSSVFAVEGSTGATLCLSTRALASKKAGAPMLCWQARASLMVVVLTVVERFVTDEEEVPIVEMRAIVKSLLADVVRRASTPGSPACLNDLRADTAVEL